MKVGNKNLYFGVVENRQDPLYLGRCKVRIVGVHTDNKIDLPTNDLPWSLMIQPITSAAMSGVGQAPLGPVEGTWVVLTFIDESQQQPIIMGTIGGIPVESNSKVEDVEDFLSNGIEQQAAVPDNAVTTSDGTPVTTGSGGNLVTEGCPELDGIPRIPPKGSGAGADAASNIGIIINACCKAGITKRNAVAAILGIVGVESKWSCVEEGYNYSASALQSLFGASSEDAAKYARKATSKEEFFNWLYGADQRSNNRGAKGRQLGNATYEDGYKYCGRGFNQLTGKYNYTKFGVSSPTDLSTPTTAADILAAFYVAKVKCDQSSPNYFEAAKKVTGGASTGYALKQQYYEYFKGEDELGNTEADKKFEPQKNDPEAKKPAAQNDINNLPNLKKKVLAKGTTDNVGFLDPYNQYPKKEWLKEPDTHRLARHQSIDKTIVVKKESERERGLAIANSGSTWEQTLVPYNAKYPFNHIMETESGHTIELDDTKGMERIHIYHKTGTFIEIDANGTVVRRTKGNEVAIMENDNTIHVLGSGVLTIDGDYAVRCGKSAQIQVQGDAQIHVVGDMKTTVDGDYDLKVGGSIRMQAAGSYSMKGGSLIAGDAGVIHWNSGQSNAAKPLESFSPSLKSLMPTTRQASSAFVLEDAPDKDRVIKELEMSNNTPDAPPVEPKKDETPVEKKEEYKTNCDVLDAQKPYTKSTRLSTNFTLGMLCKGDLPPEGGQHGLSQDEIVCNLAHLCLNVMEPLKAKYGSDLVVQSGFRVPGQVKGAAASKKTSQHELGQAVDVSFESANSSRTKKSAMYDKAVEVKQAVPFDQMIFESMGPGSAWIHLSYVKSGNRNNVLTMNVSGGTAKYDQGLKLV